uniref:Uncharacterized protein n=1 Tax=Pseudomonas putida TaxID=303 RepID=A0A6B7PWF9_PSEPU|nr:hypothetical protein [Pseudomonas putida]
MAPAAAVSSEKPILAIPRNRIRHFQDLVDAGGKGFREFLQN